MPRRISLPLLLCLFASPSFAQDIKWQRVKIDDKFRSEGVTAMDVNKDGKTDVVTGRMWYEAPNWTLHEIQPLMDYKDGAANYSNSFANWAYDLNGDGWQDLICIDFPGTPCHWLENPQNKPGHWVKLEIWHSAANESPQFLDVTGDGKPELIMASEPEGIVGYLEIPSKEKLNDKWTFTAVSVEKIPIGTHRYYHGIGAGDVNHDGRTDIIIPHGWWEAPPKSQLGSGPWTFHSLTQAVEGKQTKDVQGQLSKDGKGQPFPSADIYVDDLDLDGDNDLILSSAHQIGVWWFENVGGNGEPKFEYRLIDDTYSQTHALNYADVNGDGTKDLITGKRFWAHGPKGDADPAGPVHIYWYEIKKTKGAPPQFVRHQIGESLDSGVGTQFFVTDFDGDKRLDIVLSNKKGVNLLLQRP